MCAFYNINKINVVSTRAISDKDTPLIVIVMLLLFLRNSNAIIPVWFSDLDTSIYAFQWYYYIYAIVLPLLFLRYSNAIIISTLL